MANKSFTFASAQSDALSSTTRLTITAPDGPNGEPGVEFKIQFDELRQGFIVTKLYGSSDTTEIAISPMVSNQINIK